LAVSGVGVPLGDTGCCGVYGLELGIVAPGVLVVPGVAVPGAVVPGAVVPVVVVPDVVVPAVVPPEVVAPPVCAHAAPPASAVTTSANVAFLRSYLMARSCCSALMQRCNRSNVP
jgi:hypothetical protein